MKKSTKGALAAGSAAALLLGGAGSLAYWTSNGTVPGGAITAGELKLGAPTCDSTWKYASGAVGAGQSVTKFVPGDKITKQCTFLITATGDHLTATLTTPGTATYTGGTGTSLTLQPTATYVISAPSRTVTGSEPVTSADNGKTLTATFNVTIPFGSAENGSPKVNANDTQGLTATLNDITVSLVQTNPNTP